MTKEIKIDASAYNKAIRELYKDGAPVLKPFSDFFDELLDKVGIPPNEVMKNYDTTFSASRSAWKRYMWQSEIRNYHMFPNELNTIIGLA